MLTQRLFKYHLGAVHLPLPLSANRIRVVPPAEHTLIGTRQTRRGLHAPVALDAIEGVLVAAAAAPQHRLRPATQLDTRMGTNQLVALLSQRFAQQWRDHFFWLRVLSGSFL